MNLDASSDWERENQGTSFFSTPLSDFNIQDCNRCKTSDIRLLPVSLRFGWMAADQAGTS
jgi:hypothetical protein